MHVKEAGAVNRVELESQVLCAALRQSLAASDRAGLSTSVRELCHLFPDLLPGSGDQEAPTSSRFNFYDILQLRPQSSTTNVLAAYLAKIKQFLRTRQQGNDIWKEFTPILNAGFVLRKSRLRLSHDLVVVKRWLSEHKEILPAEKPVVVVPPVSEVRAPMAVVPPQPVPQPELVIPSIVRLMESAQIIGLLEVQALCAQMERAPNVPIEKLILNAGYVSRKEMDSLKLAEMLLAQGKISLGQFQVAMYDERSSGVRMAESLQVRGWLSTEVRNTLEEWHKKTS